MFPDFQMLKVGALQYDVELGSDSRPGQWALHVRTFVFPTAWILVGVWTTPWTTRYGVVSVTRPAAGVLQLSASEGS